MPTREEEIAWAAGLFKGEGYVSESDHRFMLTLKNTGRDVVARFDEIVRFGHLYGPYQNRERCGRIHKPFWVWVTYGYDAYDAMNLLAPWLSQRRLTRALELTGMRFPVKTPI